MTMRMVPLLWVRDIRRSVDFYTGPLGFVLAEQAGEGAELYWCQVEREGAAFMLQQSPPERRWPDDPAPNVHFYIVCDDADVIHGELIAAGLDLDPPTVAEYGMNQLMVTDHDGYRLCFENPTEPREA